MKQGETRREVSPDVAERLEKAKASENPDRLNRTAANIRADALGRLTFSAEALRLQLLQYLTHEHLATRPDEPWGRAEWIESEMIQTVLNDPNNNQKATVDLLGAQIIVESPYGMGPYPPAVMAKELQNQFLSTLEATRATLAYVDKVVPNAADFAPTVERSLV